MTIKWLSPWSPLTNVKRQRGLEAELRREVLEGHWLYTAEATCIAVRRDQDDVLYALDDGRVVLVHLHWITPARPDGLPDIAVYPSLSAWEEQSMKLLHAENDWD